jgi:hypothetical protein
MFIAGNIGLKTIVLLLLILSIVACEKPKVVVETLSPEEAAAIEKVDLFKGNWLWDSTTIYQRDSLKYTYTTKVLKKHAGTFTVVCTSPTTLALSFNNQLATLQDNQVTVVGTNTASCYTKTYEGMADGLNSNAGSVLLNAVSKDTLYNTKDSWMWMVYPAPERNKTRVYLRGNIYPRHACSIYSGWLILLNGSYLIDRLTTSLLKLTFVQNVNAQPGEKYVVYFHK